MSLGRATLPAILVLATLLPAVSAQAADAAADAPASSTACLAAAAPPCGYIVPQLALDFPDKPPCKADTLGGAVDLSKCMPLPAQGESVQQKGVLRWYWDMTQDGTYPIDPQDPIVIQFSGTATNPQYLALKVEPATFTLDAAAMASPENMKPDPATNKVWFWFEKPITVTITRTGDPNEQDLAKVSNAGGVQKLFLKAKSNASGAYFKEAFGVEEFRFDAYQDPAIQSAATGSASKDSPAVGALPVVGVVGLALALVAFRRR